MLLIFFSIPLYHFWVTFLCNCHFQKSRRDSDITFLSQAPFLTVKWLSSTPTFACVCVCFNVLFCSQGNSCLHVFGTMTLVMKKKTHLHERIWEHRGQKCSEPNSDSSFLKSALQSPFLHSPLYVLSFITTAAVDALQNDSNGTWWSKTLQF